MIFPLFNERHAIAGLVQRVPPEIIIDLKQALVRMALSGQLRRQRYATEAHLMRLAAGQQLVNHARLLTRLPTFDAVLHGAVFVAIYGFAFFPLLETKNTTLIFIAYVIGIAVSQASVYGVQSTWFAELERRGCAVYL